MLLMRGKEERGTDATADRNTDLSIADDHHSVWMCPSGRTQETCSLPQAITTRVVQARLPPRGKELLKVSREHIVVPFLGHMAAEALFRRVVGDRLGGIAAFPRLEPPAARRRVFL